MRDYLLANGGKATGKSNWCPTGKTETDPETNQPIPDTCEGGFKEYDSAFDGEFFTYNLNLGWSYNTLNRPIFPTSGMSHRVGLEIGLPGSDVDYQN